MTTPIEKQEIKGLTFGKAVSIMIAVIGFVVVLVVRDIKRENQTETITMEIKALKTQNEAASQEREALKTEDHNIDKRLTRIEDRIDLLFEKEK